MKHLFGVDYYPEHWPRERWAIDAKMMREMGITIVRMGEFSWSKWEPREGEFHFEDLDEAIEILAREGIDCILGTPSAAPPKWIIDQAPDIQPVDAHGLRRSFGGRHHDCQSNPVYRAHIRRFVTAYGEHFAKNPHVVGWQVDNELGNSHHDLCFCPHCTAAFQQWLEDKYGDIQTLNQCWGTAFWSQGYDSFAQITPPQITASGYNPSQELDWKRFCSGLVLDFHRMQAEILRQLSPNTFLTHNLMGFSEKVNYFDLGKQLDFVSHDAYPGGHFLPRLDDFRGDLNAAELDMIRGVKEQPFWIMEQQSGITGWEILGRTPRPGQLGLWAMQSIAHGADTVVFFRWRSCLMGTEQYWHGILPHSGIPGRYYQEIRAFMTQTAPLLTQVQGGMPRNEVGILFDYAQCYALRIQPHHPKLGYTAHIMTYYRALFAAHIPVDFVSATQDWSRLKVLIAPLQFLIQPALAQKLKDFAAAGGTLVLTMRSGVKDEHNLCYGEEALPCLLGDLCGLQVEEYDCLRDMDNQVRWDDTTYDCALWCDLLRVTTAKPLAVYAREFYANTPAITVNAWGKGRVYYVATQMGEKLAQRFVTALQGDAGLTSLIQADPQVEAVCREKDDAAYLFLLNHTDQPQPVTVDASWQSAAPSSPLLLPPYGVTVLQKRN